MADTHISVKAASELTGLAQSTIRNYINEEKLSRADIDGQTYVIKREVLECIPTIISLFNQKGGVGKTSLSLLLKNYYEDKEKEVLIVDLDQQANVSKALFSYDELRNNKNLYHYFTDKTPLKKLILSSETGPDLLPASISMARIGSVDSIRLKKDFVPDFLELFKKYQVVIIDCPPALNMFSTLGILLSNYIYIPVIPEPFSYDGYDDIVDTINTYKEVSSKFIDYKVIINQYDSRNPVIHKEYAILFESLVKTRLVKSYIPSFVGIKESQINNESIYKLYNETNPSLPKIKAALDELDNFMYEERS